MIILTDGAGIDMNERLEICKKCLYFLDKGEVFQCGKDKRIIDFFIKNPTSICSDNKWGSLDKTKITFSTKSLNFGKAITEWVTDGFKVPTESQISERLEICKSCEFWNENGFVGTGLCEKCGCSTEAKIRMSSQKCPIDKWDIIE